MYWKIQYVQLTLFPPTYFDLVIAYGVWEWNYPHYIFFWLEYYLLTWNLAHILSKH